MASPTDVMLAELDAELEERKHFQESLVRAAQEQKRDLRPEELELIEQASKRMTDLELRMGPLREGVRIATESSKRSAQLAEMYAVARDPKSAAQVEYRSAGAYIADLYYARMGDEDAERRIDLYNRVAAHQTTADNPGLLPERIVTPVLNFIDVARPLVTAGGVTDLGPGSWAYAKVTQHTQVGPQSAEKTELPSRKMTVTTTPITAPTLGGYVNVSKQNIQRTTPGILDMVINDLAAQYGIESEEACGTAMVAAATAGPTLPATPTAGDVAAAVFAAVGLVYGATKGQGTTVIALSPDMLGVIGPVFPPVNPQNAFGSGFNAGNIVMGNVGTISGVPAVMSAGLPDGTILVFSSAAVENFEYRYGNMQVVEPSVWGVQVGYAGDFQTVVFEPAGIIKVTATP
jgi:HK97 family phage major capsid protein